MNRKIVGAYIGVIFIFILFLIYIGNNFVVHRDTQSPEEKYERVENWSRRDVSAGEEGTKEDTVVYEFMLPQELQVIGNLAIYSVHQNIKVCIEGEEVFSLQWNKEENLFGKTPGNNWSFISLREKDCGKKVSVYVTSPYQDTLNKAPDFYIGQKEAICSEIIKQELLQYAIDFLLLLVGIILILFWIWSYRVTKRESGLVFLGTFAVELAIWLGNDLHSTILILNSPIVCTYIAFVTLMLMPIPFVMYGRELFCNKNDKSWLFICGLSFVQITVSIVLQLFNIKDFRETLFLVHGMLFIVFLWVFYHIIKEIRIVGFSRKIKMNLIGMGSCVIAAVIDVAIYYVNKNKATEFFCALTFLIYISVLGIVAMRETYQLLKLGKMAKKYQTMAYRDQMTGLYNRAAYDELINDPVVKVSGATIIMFDLNELKRCNDVYGHAAGDSYIMQSAKIISETFEKIATCCRIGGDEFCAIIPEEKGQYCEEALERLQKKVEEANLSDSEFKIHIAYGYATFDKTIDKELNDTRSRADANMYRMKFAMKEKGKSLEN